MEDKTITWTVSGGRKDLPVRLEHATHEQIIRVWRLSKKLREAYLAGKSISYLWSRKYTLDLEDLLWRIRFTPEFREYCEANNLDVSWDASDIMC